MSLTQEQWYQKLLGFVPSWYIESPQFQRAQFQALAKLLADSQEIAAYYKNQTYLGQAEEPFLDLHGDERGVERLTDEENDLYAIRIRNIINQSNKSAIKALVDSILIRGTCEIREGIDVANPYFSRMHFFNRNEFFNDYHYNVFTIVIDKQVHDPYSCFSRGNYFSRGDYLGSLSFSVSVFNSILAAVNKVKALGVLYKIVERH